MVAKGNEKNKERIYSIQMQSVREKTAKKKAKKAGLSLSEFCLRSALDVKVVEILNEEQIEFYKTLIKYSNNFTSIGNMYRKQNPKLTEEVYALAKEMKDHLNNFKNDRQS